MVSRPLNRPESFELHAHKRFAMDGFQVNSWVRNKTGRVSIDQDPEAIVLVEQDINTTPEDIQSRSFSSEEIRRFFVTAASELESILRLYYPPGATR
jgi:hypothetical protein